METIIVHHRSSHHASNSGYGRLADYLDAQIIYGNIKFPYRLAKLLAKFYSKSKGSFNVNSVLKFIELYQLLIKTKGQKNIVHFLNGERDIRHIGFLKGKFPDTYFCATFHKPPEVLRKTIKNTSSLSRLDGVIAVGANQVDFLKGWLKLDNVVYIPHGVDTNFFTPDYAKNKNHTLLFVGQHLRDFKTFNYCIPKIAEMVPDLSVNVIIHSSYKKYIEPHKAIKVFSEINDIELKKYYQTASVLFLPMLNSTACNSILEAMACGVPIITTDIGGNLKYLDETNNILAPVGNHNYLAESTIDLLNDFEKRESIEKSSRKKALDFDWKKIAKEISSFYKQILIN